MAIETRVVRFDARADPPRHPPRAEPRRARSTSSTTASTTSTRSPTRSSRSCPRRGSAIGHGQMAGEELEEAMLRLRHAARPTSWWRPRSSRAAWTSPTSTRSSSTRPTSTAWPTCTSSAAGSAATSTGPMPICCWTPTSRSRPTRSSGSRRSRSSPSWGPASRSPCATWRSAAPATSWAPQQSGPHRGVGYELYCSLLENAVRELKNQPRGRRWR